MRPLPAQPSEAPLPATPAAASLSPASSPPRSAAAPLAPVGLRPPPTSQVEDPLYPSSDGQPMAENTWQFEVMVDSALALRSRYQRNPDVFVGGDLLMYYERGNPTRRVAPDVFVIFGVPDHHRMSYRLWDEGKAPDFALEVASESTWREDLGRKRDLYAKLGIQEYWLFDPQGEFFDPPLRGLVLQDGEYGELPGRMENGVRVLRSRVLGLDLRAEGGALRFRDPVTGEDLRTLEEETAARQHAEAQRDQEAKAHQRAQAANGSAQARNAELEAQVRALEARLAAERQNSLAATPAGGSAPSDGQVSGPDNS